MNTVVVGAQWGDEGKGKVVDFYARDADAVVRFNGGNNAGHTLVVNGKQTIVHTLPSGLIYPDKTLIIGNGVVIDPEVLIAEMGILERDGTLNNERRLFISDRAHIILPAHKTTEAKRELVGTIGTTKKGIGPTYEAKAGRIGVRVIDLFQKSLLEKRIEEFAEGLEHLREEISEDNSDNKRDDNKKAELEDCVRIDNFHRALLKQVEELQGFAGIIEPFVANVSAILYKFRDEGKNILFEGAQGALLDLDHGTYPYVTSSNSIASSAATGSGVGVDFLERRIGVVKAYTTRVGRGPFPTRMCEWREETVRKIGGEYGATTGRPRDCGWLDLVALRHSVRVNGFTGLAITKLDVLGMLSGEIKVCGAYSINGRQITQFPAGSDELAAAKPIYIKLPPFEKGYGRPTLSDAISNARSISDLPHNTVRYIRVIEDELGVPVSLVSVGPDREQTIVP